jgi:transcriptional accessory protein Tex/SPT6
MYLQNPFVVLGAIGIIYHLWRRKQLSIQQTEYDELLKAYLKKQTEKDSDGLYLSFKKDVENMSNEDVLKSIKENEENLLNIKDENQKKELAKMIQFCADTYNSRSQNKKFAN